jgi:hypothetical protein
LSPPFAPQTPSSILQDLRNAGTDSDADLVAGL